MSPTRYPSMAHRKQNAKRFAAELKKAVAIAPNVQPVIERFDFQPDTCRDVEGLVHGIVSVDPPIVRCDGCGHTASGLPMAALIITCGIEFNPHRYARGDHRRLCRECAAIEWGEAA